MWGMLIKTRCPVGYEKEIFSELYIEIAKVDGTSQNKYYSHIHPLPHCQLFE